MSDIPIKACKTHPITCFKLIYPYGEKLFPYLWGFIIIIIKKFPGPAFSLTEVNAHCSALGEKVHPTAESSCLSVPCQDLKSQDKTKKGTTSWFPLCLVFREGEWAQGNLAEDGVAVGCQIQCVFDGSLEHPSFSCLLTPSKCCCNAVQHRYHCSSYLWDKTVWKTSKRTLI